LTGTFAKKNYKMPCVNPDGTLTIFSKKVLAALKTPSTEVEIAERISTPLYRVRSNLRELVEFGLVRVENGIFRLIEADNRDNEDEPIPSDF
jgi:hypothetical protein